jgi:DNA polymerase I
VTLESANEGLNATILDLIPTFQPEPGLYEKVHQIDFTSLYPSIIVKYNLSPETIEHPELKGFLSTVLSSLLNLRIETKRLTTGQQRGYSGCIFPGSS